MNRGYRSEDFVDERRPGPGVRRAALCLGVVLGIAVPIFVQWVLS